MYREAEEERPYLVVVEQEMVRALDVRSGAEVWGATWEAGSGPPDMAIARGRVFLATIGKVYCLDYRTGEALWRAECETSYSIARPTILVDRERVFVSIGRRVLCFDLRGQRLWGADGGTLLGRTMGLPGNVRHADLTEPQRD
jgi:outer membrane protein assembly factor BamB